MIELETKVGNLEQSLIGLPENEENKPQSSELKTCKKFYESEMDEFKRMDDYFNPTKPDLIKLDPMVVFSKVEALGWYGIYMQGLIGDNNEEAPTWFDLVERLKWNAWDGKRGMDSHEARVEFIAGSRVVLTDNGESWEHPDKAIMNQEYNECVEANLASGVTQDEIDAESDRMMIQQKKESEESTVFIMQGHEYKSDWINNMEKHVKFLDNQHRLHTEDENSASII